METHLRRYDLVWISDSAWDSLIAQQDDPAVADCLATWRLRRLPLVVTRQRSPGPWLAVGLPAPLAWARRRIALHVNRCEVLCYGRFPRVQEVLQLLPPARRDDWRALCSSLADCDVEARVHGSFGWHSMTSLPYLTAQSDIDLLLPVQDVDIADAVAKQLDALNWECPRLDGELIFPNGHAVSWREWLQWRKGGADQILVKQLHTVTLESGLQWTASPSSAPA